MDKCREAFERHQAVLTGTDYEVLKAHFDNNEQYFGSRYNEGSQYERDWFVWEACWKSRQAEVDQLQSQINEMAEVGLSQESAIKEKNKRIRNAVAFLNEIHKRSLDNPEVWDLVDDVWEALRGNDQYKEHRAKAEEQINKGARLTKHQIDLGDNNANS